MDPLEKWQLVEESLKGNDGPYVKSLGCHRSLMNIREAIQRSDLFRPSKFKPFPLDDAQVRDSSYHVRGQIEDELIASYNLSSRKNILLMVAPEGFGKTTLLHYIFGYKIPRMANIDGQIGSFILLEARNWVAASSSNEFYNRITAEISTYLRSPDFQWARTAYDEFRKAAAAIGSELPGWPAMADAQFATDLLAFVAVFNRNTPKRSNTNFIVTVIFDNMDQMPAKQQIDLFRAIYTFNFTTEERSSQFRELLGLMAWESHQDDKICAIVPMRPNTYKTLTEGIGSIIHPRPERMIVTRFQSNRDLNIWEMIASRLSNHVIFSSQYVHALRVSDFFHGDGADRYGLSVDDPKHYFQALMAWISNVGGRTADGIQLFCNSSLRRELLFGLKVIGHPGVRYLYDQIRLLKPVSSGRELRNLQLNFWDFMYDLEQPLGWVDRFENDTFLLNPFCLLSNKASLRAAPQLGFQFLNYLMDQHAEDDIVQAATLERDLTAIGYEPSSVKEACRALSATGVLLPSGDREGTITRYQIEPVSLQKYLSLMQYQDFWESYVFIANCIRHIKNYNSFLPPEWKLLRVALNLYFLYRAYFAEKNLSIMLHNRRPSGPPDTPIKSYLYAVGRGNYRKLVKLRKSIGLAIPEGDSNLTNLMAACDEITGKLDGYFDQLKSVYVTDNKYH
jgi:hypothetical protein